MKGKKKAGSAAYPGDRGEKERGEASAADFNPESGGI
jgi:hypothetical protein